MGINTRPAFPSFDRRNPRPDCLSRYIRLTGSSNPNPPSEMCEHEIVGDYYRGCGHFHGRYYTGEVQDCNSTNCKASKAHKHTARNCGCINVVTNVNRVQNMFQAKHPDCQ
ncbi:hypothetical protein BJ322DRAFT_869527 [Thelephora terrestris]|uniref:Uncharacterized protein n=1 Tax=Thelephora terrestris TaxID=56493 RepID=A0A9P6HFF9_9AGAM|nr:hypothetical protein BJ322DRAFT_869527 [Thelephora terrestris]